ncbi:MAG: spore cortex biosynthesis protein YabQ [Peptococcia bacterium]|jgi:spore cortex biosynthesis protein YabQ
MFVLDQVIVFSLVTVWGSFVGIIFDCFRTLRRVWRAGHWGTSLGDIVFWLLVTVFTYLLLMLLTWGEVRFYIFLGMGLGLCLYLKFFSKIIRKYLLKVFFYGKDVFLYLNRLFSKPLKFLRKVFSLPVRVFKKRRRSSKPPFNPPGELP